MIKAVIFDLDGVIVSTDTLHYKAWKKMSDKEGIHFNEEINHQLRGISRMESLEIILRNAPNTYTEIEKIALAEYKNNLYAESLNELSAIDILPGILEVLDVLQKADIKIAIGSSSRNAKKILLKIGLIERFDAISDGTNISLSKPHPEVFEKAAEMLELPYEECVVVEDAVSGIVAAKACNMLAFAVGDAMKSPLKDYDFDQLLTVVIK